MTSEHVKETYGPSKARVYARFFTLCLLIVAICSSVPILAIHGITILIESLLADDLSTLHFAIIYINAVATSVVIFMYALYVWRRILR